MLIHHTPDQPQQPDIQQLQTTALALLDAGISVIPLHDKEPYDPYKRPYHDSKTGAFIEYPRLKWKLYTTKQPKRRQVERWFSPTLAPHNQPNGIGYCTGQVSGSIQVLDFESEQRYHAWHAAIGDELADNLPTLRTGRGYNVVWTCPTPYTAKDHDPGQVEARGDQLYSIAPPSWHPKAKRQYAYTHGDLLHLPHLNQATSDRLIAAAAAVTIPTLSGSQHTRVHPQLQPPPSVALTGEELRTLYNTSFDLESELRRYAGRPASAGRWHCPAYQDHEHHDQDGSFDVSPSKHPEKYGQLIGGCWQPTCRLFGTKGRIISAFDLMQIMEGLTRRDAHRIAAERLGLAYSQHVTTAAPMHQKALETTEPDEPDDTPDDGISSLPDDDPDLPPLDYEPETPATTRSGGDRYYSAVFWGVEHGLLDFLTEMRTVHKCMPATLFYAQAIRSMGREGTILEMQTTIRIHHCSYSDRHVKNARRQFHQLAATYTQLMSGGEIISPPSAHIEEVNLIQAETTPPTAVLGCDFVSNVPQVAPDPDALDMQLAQERIELDNARSAGDDRQLAKERVKPSHSNCRSRPLHTPPTPDDLPELKRRRYAAQRAAQRAHEQGNVAQARAITRSIRTYREQIECIEHELIARQAEEQASRPPTLFDVAQEPVLPPATIVSSSYTAATGSILEQNHTSPPVVVHAWYEDDPGGTHWSSSKRSKPSTRGCAAGSLYSVGGVFSDRLVGPSIGSMLPVDK